MKHCIILLLIGLFMSSSLKAQVKIGDNPQNIDPSSVLELESSSRVLVITRINTAEMDAIVPNQGALVYNTDTQCVHYYNGIAWVNLCESANGNGIFTTDPIVNTAAGLSTIVITPTADGNNFEVALNSIGSDQIQDGGIIGADIQDNSITANKLSDDSVGRNELAENAVGIDALDTSEFNLSDFFNDEGFITDVDIVSADVGNSIETRADGAFLNQQPLLDDIIANNTLINTHITADNDTSADNEIQNLSLSTGNVLSLSGTTGTVDLGVFNNTGTDEQNLETATLSPTNILTIDIENGDPVTVDLNALAGTGTDNQNLETATLSPTNMLTIDIENGDPVTVDLNALAGTGTDSQNLETAILSPTNILTIDIENGDPVTVDLNALAGTGTDSQNLETAILSPTNILTIDIENGDPVTVDLNGLAGTGSDNQNLETAILSPTNMLTIDIENGDPVTVDLSGLAGTGTDNQQLTLEAGNLLTLEGDTTPINLTPFLDNQTITDFTFNNTSNILTLTLDGGNTDTADLSSLAGGGTQNAAQVPFTATGNTIADDVQEAIQELQTEIDGISTGGAANPNDELITNFSLNGTELNIAEGANILPFVDLDLVFATDTELTAAITASEALDLDNSITNEIELPDDTAATSGQVLATDGAGTYTWVDDQISTAAIVSANTPNSITPGTDGGALYDDSTLITNIATNTTGLAAHILADEDTDSTNEIELPDDTAATSGQVLATDGAGTYTWVDDQISTAAIVSANTPNSITPGTDGGALYDDSTLITNIATNTTGLAAHILADEDTDSTNEIELPDDTAATSGQVLATDGAGTYSWVDDQTTTATIVSANTPNSITPGTDGGALYDDTALSMVITANTTALGNKENSINKSNDATLADASTIEFPTEFAVKSYVDDNAGANLFSTNLTLVNDRAHDLDGNNLILGGSGNIAIGTLPGAPQDKLDVNGQIRARSGFAASTGSASFPTYGFYTNSDNDTGMYRPAADEIGFSVGGIEALNIDETSSSTTVIINETLELQGDLLDANNSSGTAGQVLSSTGTGTDWIDQPNFVSPIKAFGKISGAGDNLNTSGANVTGSAGSYTVTLATARPNNNYVIQLTTIANLKIFVLSQTTTSFEVRVITDGGITFAADWHFTVID